ALIQSLELPAVLVTPSTVGAIGRTLQTLTALRANRVRVVSLILLGKRDCYAEEQLLQHGGGVHGASLSLPAQWDRDSIRHAAQEQRQQLQAIHQALAEPQTRRATTPAELLTRDRAVVWHPYTSLEDPAPPLPVARANAEFLELADGRVLID